ncbi:Hypothetical protein NTJ_02687 [Nesidiocoris tenuis]|uniref:Uncharacterized protein n=1 Tax=Nesidiocoris tenuis TaxID=355587 RepID=A0ABN7AFE1_9HEMI|nr:Hypothetical protein NTJ_02687 [Nesidiocoris tenuis]
MSRGPPSARAEERSGGMSAAGRRSGSLAEHSLPARLRRSAIMKTPRPTSCRGGGTLSLAQVKRHVPPPDKFTMPAARRFIPPRPRSADRPAIAVKAAIHR